MYLRAIYIMTFCFSETRRNSEMAIFGESSVPPPMSLSAPEIGGGETLVTSPLRNAVSSTELLHEQAMARFYQAVAAEEAEKARERKDILDRRPSNSSDRKRRSLEAEDVDIRNISRKTENKPVESPVQELTWHQRKKNIFQERRDSNEGFNLAKKETPEPEINIKPILMKKEPARLSTREEEEAIFETVRQKRADKEPELPKPPEVIPRSILRNRQVEKEFVPKYYEEKKPLEVEKVEIKYELEQEEDLEEEEEEVVEEEEVIEEEEYIENEELDGEESTEEDNSEFEEEEELYKRIEEEEQSYPSNVSSRRFDKFAEEEEEEETYHPRSMIPAAPTGPAPIVRTLERQLTPRPSNDVPFYPKSILKSPNMTFQQQLEEMVERPRGIVARELERSPPKSFRDNYPKGLLPQFSSDTVSRTPSPDTLSPSPPLETPSPQPLSPSPPPFSTSPFPESPSPEPELLFPLVTKLPEPRVPHPMSPEPEFFMAEGSEEDEDSEKFMDTEDISQTETKPPLPPVDYQVSVPEISPVHPAVPISQPVPAPRESLKPEVPPPKPSASPTRDPTISPSEAARQKKMLIRKLSLEEDAEEKRAMADHYGEIIRDYSRPKRSSKKYTTISEMKAAAAAAAARERERLLMTPEPTRSPTPEPEPEPEPEFEELSKEEQTVIVEQSAYDRYTAPASRSTTPTFRKSRTPDLVLIRQSSKDRSRKPSTERFAAQLSKQFPEVARRFSPERTVEAPPKPEPRPPLVLPKKENPKEPVQEETESKMRFILSYLADLAMFVLACWLYVFKDERYAIPILVLLVYRQIYIAVKKRLPKLPRLPWKKTEDS